MYVHKQIITIAAPPEKVFEYITTPANFPLWLKDVWIAGRTFGEMGLGCRIIQTIRVLNPRKFTMQVIGYVKNRYFRIQAVKGFLLLPGYVFSFKPCKGGHTELIVYVELRTKRQQGEEDDFKGFRFFYPTGVSHHWKVYLQLLEKGIMKGMEEDKKKLSQEKCFKTNLSY
jgi:hypothetical protein